MMTLNVQKIKLLSGLLALALTVGLGMPPTTHAGMDPFIGEISCGGYNFCPLGYAECNGQLITIASNTALFSLLGTYYGGDGRTNFALPNIQGRTMLHQGQGSGMTLRNMGETGGAETVALTAAQLPQHSHSVAAHTGSDRSSSPTGKMAGVTANSAPVYTASAANTSMAAGTVANSGGSLPHNNLQPYLAIKCCIAVTGIYPARP